jgi:hypothetical protein
MAESPTVCLTCRRRFASTRGNCPSCYSGLRKRVARGLTTWGRLEAEGKAAPATRTGCHPWFRRG